MIWGMWGITSARISTAKNIEPPSLTDELCVCCVLPSLLSPAHCVTMPTTAAAAAALSSSSSAPPSNRRVLLALVTLVALSTVSQTWTAALALMPSATLPASSANPTVISAIGSQCVTACDAVIDGPVVKAAAAAAGAPSTPTQPNRNRAVSSGALPRLWQLEQNVPPSSESTSEATAMALAAAGQVSASVGGDMR